MAALPKSRVSALGLPLTMSFVVFQGVIIALFVAISGAEDPAETYDVLYRKGMEAYHSGSWFKCEKFMSAALDDFKMYHNVLTDCRIKCNTQGKTNIDVNEFMDMAFYDITLKRSDCLRRCKKEMFGARPMVLEERVEHDMKNLEPYNYIQMCAYKLERYKQAASSAYTYLLAHPDHPQMKSNMVFYKTMPHVKPGYFMNLEAKGFQVRYQDGVEAYSEEQYADVIEAIEEALVLYYTEARRCDALCEGPYDHESLPDHVNAVADHYIHVLECRVECPHTMATFMGQEVENFLPEHYNYLQFSYYKVGEPKKACAAAATYLLFDPVNTEMLSNKQFFLNEEGITEDWFIPRQDASVYYKKRQLELQQVRFIQNSYMFGDSNPDRDGLQKGKYRKYETTHTPLRFGPQDAKYKQTMARHLQRGIDISQEGQELQGEHRVVVDNVITQEEADKLVDLAGMATQGDGYGDASRSSPHTDFEKFEGMTIMKAALLAKYGHVSEELAQLYLSVSERMRELLEDYWNLVTPLYFHFTHLVCRTALEEEPGYQCYRDAEDTKLCIDPPKPSGKNAVDAILYLNGGFEGGNFFFAHKNLSVQQIVEPRTARMVAFEAGDFHGVQAVTKGRRCALALWFTMSELDAEIAHREAAAILRHKQTMQRISNPALQTMLEEEDIRVVKTEEELNGPERFAADHLVTKEECEKLIQLANGGGRVGDGYSSSRTTSSMSPHTQHEKFAALTVNTAAEEGGIQGDGYRSATARGKRNNSPHTSHEMFEGLTLIRATQLAAEGKVDLDAVELYLDIAEKGRKLVEAYFGLKSKLYFDFTHLVCRTALHGDNMVRTDLSHPVHSDNCILQPDGSCRREPPAYIQRDYSAIIYLNGDFKGGEFFFTHSNLTVQASLKPHEGMLVGFNAGNFHGVKAVQAGQRCAIALWYTLNPKFEEKAHIIARKLLRELRAKQKPEERDEL